jgi:hypothetical protein
MPVRACCASTTTGSIGKLLGCRRSAHCGTTAAHQSATMFRMANTTETYRRETADGPEMIKIMAYLGSDSGDSDEIRRIVERDGTVLEDGIAYFGMSGQRWLEEQRSAYIAEGFESLPD